MISDSIPWKEELLKIADRLERRKTQRRWLERTSFLVERDIMVSAYALRKLLEAGKISDRLASRRVAVKQYALLHEAPDMFNRYFCWENYDLETGVVQKLSIQDLCNQIIHSWNWNLSAGPEETFDGVYVSSDRSRRRLIYFVDVDVLVQLLRDVGSEEVTSIEMRRDDQGEMRIVRVLTRDEVGPYRLPDDL